MFQTKIHKTQNNKSPYYLQFALFLISILFFSCNPSKELKSKDLWPWVISIQILKII